MEYSVDMDDIYKNNEVYNLNKKRKILIVFDDIIADILSKKKLNPIAIEFLIRDKKLFYCFYYTVLLFCAKKYQTKFCAPFYF